MKKIVLFILGLSFSLGISAQVSKTINVTTAGTLSTLLKLNEKNNTTNLILTGNLDARDFVVLRDEMKSLNTLDLSNITIDAYSGGEGTDYWSDYSSSRDYAANQLPFSAFDSDSIISTIILPNSITSIGSYSLYSCKKLSSITIPSSVTDIGIGPFVKCNSLDSIKIPATVKSIGNYAFSSCDNLLSVILPPSLDSIKDYTFSNCKSLDSIAIPATVVSLGKSAFYSCESLHSVILPASLDSIKESTFENCLNLDSIIIPSSVVSIGKSAFYYCENLQTVNLPTSLNSIKANAFGECTNLKSIVIPSSVDSIGESAFYSCKALQSINLPATLKAISANTFEYCKSLKTISIPSSVSKIGKSSFSGCDSLNSIIIPNSVDTIDNYAFEDCKLLKTITIPNSVKYLGSHSFTSCISLKSVVIPSSIKSLSPYVFSNCDSLRSVSIPNTVTAIEYDAFYGCDSLKTINIPASVTSIGDEAFSDCQSIESLVIPSSVTKIGVSAFENCYLLSSINIPTSLSTLSNRIFYECRKLKNIHIPSSIDTIGRSAFSHCYYLDSVYLPSSITYIDAFAFYYCDSLKSINIPNSVDTIGNNAFLYDNLKVLKAFTGPLIIDDEPLTGDTLYIPVGTKAAYEKSGNYKFKYIIEFEACVASANLIKIPGQGIMPSISFNADTTICPGQNLTIKAPLAASYSWSNSATTQSLKVTETGTYSVTITAPNGCTNSASEKVLFHQPYAEQIKLATFNKANNAVIIAWTPTKGKQIASYALQLLDDMTGKYKTIANRGLTDSTYVVDKKADVKSQTYSYRLIAYDSVCNDSAISDVHETIHLSCSQSTNASTEVQLSWNTYKGLSPDVYKVYAISNGVAVDSFSLANNGNQTFQRTYSNHKAGYTYRIGFDLKSPVFTGTLKSDSGPYSQSLSNLAESELTAITQEEASKIEIYPNPANASFTVSINEPATINIYSNTSQLIFSKSILSNEKISLDGIAVGTYIVKIKTSDAVITRSLVVVK